MSLCIMIALLILSGCNSNDVFADGDDDIFADGDADTADGETDGDTEVDVDVDVDVEDDSVDGDTEADPCEPNPCDASDNKVCEADTGACICDTGFCEIGDTCIADGTENPVHVCSVCDSTANKEDWSLRKTGYECRASAGVCDVAESCDGVNNDCPADVFIDNDEICNDDDNACNGVNTCQAGTCTETTAAVTCTALDECHVAGVCDTATGVCSNSNQADGTICETDNQCVSGVCEDCFDLTGCGDFTEDENSCTNLACNNNTCVNMNDDNNTCTDGNPCTHNDLCSSGTCTGTPYSCNDGLNCTSDTCNGDNTCTNKIISDRCLIEGVCYTHEDDDPANECRWCLTSNSQTEWVYKANGAACTDDGLDCTDDICSGSGSCIHNVNDDGCLIAGTCYDNQENDPSNECQWCLASQLNTGWTGKANGFACTDDGNDCTDDICDGSAPSTCTHPIDDTNNCDDGEDCTDHDECSGGICSGTMYFCENSGVCNSNNNICTCTTGFTGDYCDTCAIGFSGEYCDTCATGFSGYPDCNTENFVTINAGSFWMGSPDGEYCPEGYPGDCSEEPYRNDDETLHEVTIDHDFEMSRYEVTEAEWENIMGRWYNVNFYCGIDWVGGDDHPRTCISWYDAIAYAIEFSVAAGLEPCYGLKNVECQYGGEVGSAYMNCFDRDDTNSGIQSATVTGTWNRNCGYRLPTEEEWEYAARAGTTTAFYNGDLTASGNYDRDWRLDTIGWYYWNSCDRNYGTNPVGEKLPNAWGLYDMSGNVSEWTSTSNSTSAIYIRGGGFCSPPCICRLASRAYAHPSKLGGIRLVRYLTSSPTCDDRIHNGNETDTDCGGPDCDPCETDKDCMQNFDCESLVCNYGVCQQATCNDSVHNGDEEDVDCGGSCDACPPVFVPITAGTFWMGSPQSSTCPDGYPGVCADELGNESDEVLHEVTLTYDFVMNRYETTQAEFEALMGYNPSKFSSCGSECPVEQVSWHEFLAYANAFSVSNGLEECFDCTGTAPDFSCSLKPQFSKPQDCKGYRLPTEAEWEYAIRSGSEYTAFHQSEGNNGRITHAYVDDSNLDQIGWYNTSSGTKPVGGKEPNAWGLYDMSGNLYEWTWDWYQSEYQNDVATDPVGPDAGSRRIIRGGNWPSYASYCRSADRNKVSPGGRGPGIGGRLCRSIP